jgi:alpha-ketoglutarate-dependent taurine dioxygenase
VQLNATPRFENAPAANRFIKARPLTAALGAEICGVDLREIHDEQFAEIRQALFRHKMLYFRGQNLTHAQHEAFSLRFGAFAEDAYTSGIPGHPNVHPLIKEPDDPSGRVFGEGWHTDSPFLPKPPAITILRSIEIPPYGGDTTWANAALAYSALSDIFKQIIGGLKVHFSLRDVLAAVQQTVQVSDSPMGRLAATRGASTLSEDLQRKIRGTFHPMVRTHPVTGEKSLYVDPTYAVGIEGMQPGEAAPVLNYLFTHITQPVLGCRLRWEADMLVLWDNRLCLHQAYNDYAGFRREMYRTTVVGEIPV